MFTIINFSTIFLKKTILPGHGMSLFQYLEHILHILNLSKLEC